MCPNEGLGPPPTGTGVFLVEVVPSQLSGPSVDSGFGSF